MSKDAKIMLYHMYKEYLLRRKNHFTKSNAKHFGGAEVIRNTFFPDWYLDDVVETLRELGRNEFVKNFYADNTVYYCTLTDNAIAVMEKQKKETLLNVLDFISKFIP